MRFLLAGGTAAAVNWASRFLFQQFMPYQFAIIAAYGLGMIIAFELSRRFVFPPNPDARLHQFSRFAAVNAVSFAVVWLVSMLLGDLLLPRIMAKEWAEALGHGIGILSPALLSYGLHKHFTFRYAAPATPPTDGGDLA